MSENKSVWDQELFKSKKSKITVLVLIGLTLLTLAILVWLNSTGRISIGADTTTTTYNKMTMTQTCTNGQQTNVLGVLSGIGNAACKCTYYVWLTTTNPDGDWAFISRCTNILRDQKCTYGPMSPHGRRFKVICNCTGGKDLGPIRATPCGGGTTPTPTPTCVDQCKPGDSNYPLNIKCINSTQYQSCRLTDGCYKWVGPHTCSDSKLCDNQKGCYANVTTTPTPTYSPAPTTTPVPSLKLNYDRGECVVNSNIQKNYLNWSGARDVDLYYKDSNNTNQWILIKYYWAAQESNNNYSEPHEYESTNTLEYMAKKNNNQTIFSTVKALNSQCSGPTPSPTVSPTTSPTTSPTASPTTSPTTSPTASPTTSPTPTPSAPTNLVAQSLSSSEIKLFWNGTLESGEGFYRIYNADTGVLLVQVDSTNTEWPFNGLNCETEYSYYITANIDGLESDPSNTASATTGQCSVGPNITNEKPQNIQLIYNGGGMATLSWDKLDGATGYDIYDCSGNYIVSTANPSYTFTGLGCGQDLCYYVIAHNAAGENSLPSDSATASTEACASGDDSGGSDIGTLISTGGALWFNILLAVLLTGALSYLFFRRDIWEKK